MSDIQARMQALSEEYKKIQTELDTSIQARQKLEAQLQENKGVEKEFGKLKDDEAIYKLSGPILLKQEKVEADSTVKGRIEFITKEIARLEKQISDGQDKLEKKKGEIIQVQSNAQAASQPQAAQA
ncbi:hypothetical protein GGTG_02506 [Gaeumannomyces tritici R3-111a-1]|uniref:Prefoldin subunit 6 n=1 Tax=Gaeumannomyces tritici (strain R3-111a-1) TaxID=644352 RepID=J3NMK0_GAET3|nr:hypothetical protein GGTG_02506 [Gaeumannomyces tritici R3-111a-1]EJT82533.1 hypothetical protein GGTG_02506 [Gaeumannomyces tritici R3-111a-1]